MTLNKRACCSVAIPIIYKIVEIGDAFKADIVVERQALLEIKAIAAILPEHEAQLHTYLRLSNIRVGPLMNFNAPRLIDGLRRYIV